MSRTRGVIASWALTIAATGLLPPWRVPNEFGSWFAGYHPLWHGPSTYAGVDLVRLAIAWLVLTAAACAVYVCVSKTR